MQRTRLLILVAVLTLAIVALAGARLLARLNPEVLRAELRQELQAWLGMPVEMGSARLVLIGGVGVQASDLTAGTGADAPGIDVQQIRALLDLRSALLGRLELRRVELAGVRARLERTPDGWSPAVVEALLRGPATEETAEQRLGESLVEAARLVLRVPAAAPALEIDDAEVVLLGGAGRVARRLAFTDASIRLEQRAFGRGHRLRASGQLLERGAPAGRVTAEALLRDGQSDLELTLEELSLSALAPLWTRLAEVGELAGSASGVLNWRFAAPHGHELELRLDGRSMALRADLDAGPLGLDLPRVRIEADARADSARLTLSRLRLESGDARIEASGELELPAGDAAGSDLRLSLRELPLAASRDALVWLLPEGGGGVRELVGGLQAGRLVRLELRGSDVSLAGWRRLASDPLGAWPESLTAELELDGATLQLPGAGRLARLSGAVSRTSERLSLRGIDASLDGRPLPRLELRIRGVEHLRGAGRAAASRPPRLVGQSAAWDWIRAQRNPDGTGPRWSRVEVRADYLDHMALPWPVTWVRAELEPGAERTAVRIESARLGGVPIRGQGSFGGRGPGSVVFTLEAAAHEPEMPAVEVAEGVWARGRVSASLTKLGRFPAEQVTARFRGKGSTLDFRDAWLVLRPSGDVRGSVRLDLSRESDVPFEASLQVENAPAPAIAEGLKLDPEGLLGTVQAGTVLRGRLRAHESLAAHLEGPLSFHVRQGEARRRIPALLAIATTSEVINPFRGRESVPFEALDAELQLSTGRLEAEQITMDGPAIRMLATGRVALGPGPHALEGVLGVFFFPAVDSALGKVPVLSRLLLGSDKNLISGYFALTGTWEQPEAEMIPTKTLASGPVNLVVALPGFVHAGLKRLQRLVPGGGTAEAATETPPAEEATTTETPARGEAATTTGTPPGPKPAGASEATPQGEAAVPTETTLEGEAAATPETPAGRAAAAGSPAVRDAAPEASDSRPTGEAATP